MRIMIFILLLATLLVVNVQGKDKNSNTFQNEISQPTHYIEQPFDVISYDLTLNLLEYKALKASGVCKIKFEWKNYSDENKLFFHLRSLKVDSVLYWYKKVKAIEIGTPADADYHYEVAAEPEFASNEVELSVYYSGTMTGEQWGGVHYNKTDQITYSFGVGFKNNYVSATQHWMPCYDHPSDKAKFHAKFIVPAGIKVASNGEMKVHYLDNGTDIYEYDHNYQCATNLLTFAVSDYHIFEKYVDGLPFVFFSKTQDTTISKFVYQNVPKMLDFFQLRFGNYPFEKVGYVNTPDGNMEHQTMISMSKNYLWYVYDKKDTNDAIIAHELSHQWFGNSVTPYDYRDAWLNEGFATFCEALWAERLGYNKYIEKLDGLLQFYLSKVVSDEGLMTLYDYPRNTINGNYPATIYYKGALVLGMLRFKLGQEFPVVIQHYLDSLKYGNTTSKIFKEIIERDSWHDLSQFFEQWVYSKGIPEISVRATRYSFSDKDSIEIEIEQVQPEEYGIFKELLIEIGFENANKETIYKIFEMNVKKETFRITVDSPIERITINKGPDLRTLLKVADIAFTSVNDHNTYIEKPICSPNPAWEFIDIAIPEQYSECNVTIYDFEGRTVFMKIVSSGVPNMRVNTDKFSQGTYFVVLQKGQKTYKEKIVILK